MAILLAVLVGSAATLAAEPAGTFQQFVEPPPARPAALTAPQYDALLELEALPEHSRILDTSVTYSTREESLEFTRFSDDFWTLAYDIGWPGTYLGVLICAAPL